MLLMGSYVAQRRKAVAKTTLDSLWRQNAAQSSKNGIGGLSVALGHGGHH